MDSPPGPELLGAFTSHGPSRESYTPCRKARGRRAERPARRPQSPAVLAEGMRAALSSRTRAAALLQRGVPGGGAGVVGVEGPAGVPGHGGGQSRSGTGKAGATGSASKSENRQRKRRFQRPRGSSLGSFFDGCCDRPGCYECFVRSRRSPLQRFCSQACQRAMERVWERERRWRQEARPAPPSSWKAAPGAAAVRARRTPR